MFRISRPGQCDVVDVDTMDQLASTVQSLAPGRYRVYEIVTHQFDPLRVARYWGALVKHTDASVTIKPHPGPW